MSSQKQQNMIEELLANQKLQQEQPLPPPQQLHGQRIEEDDLADVKPVTLERLTGLTAAPQLAPQPAPKPLAPRLVAKPQVVARPAATTGQPVGHSHSAKGWEPAVVAHTLENVIKAATATRAALKKKYGEELAKKLFALDPVISYSGGQRAREAEKAGLTAKGMPPPPATPVFLDSQSRGLLVKRMLGKLALPKGDPLKRFVVAIGGHSSAAGHGNFFNESYAFAMERQLKPVFAAAGIELVVRNHAMGGTGCVPSAYCIGTVYGTDLDAIGWDFGMTDGRNIDHGELYFRQAVLQTVAAQGPRSSPPLMLLAHNTDNQREELVRHYRFAGFEVAGIRTNMATDLCPRTEGPEHAMTLPHALRYIECADSVAWEDCKAQRYDCTQVCGPEAGKVCHGQVSWHPGWRYHQLKGDLLATPFLEALSDAARRYQRHTMDVGPNLDPEAYTVPAFPDERPLPDPLVCGKEGQSSVDAALCSVALSCATSFEPRLGAGPLELAPLARAPGGSTDADQSPATKKLLAKYSDGGKGGKGGWRVQLAPGEGDNTAACTGHLDQKFNMLAGAGGGWLAMVVPNVKVGVLIVCEGPFSAREKKKVEYLNTSLPGGNALMELDGWPYHYARKLTKSLCSVVADDLTPGTHVLALQATSASALTGFSHVIWA